MGTHSLLHQSRRLGYRTASPRATEKRWRRRAQRKLPSIPSSRPSALPHLAHAYVTTTTLPPNHSMHPTPSCTQYVPTPTHTQINTTVPPSPSTPLLCHQIIPNSYLQSKGPPPSLRRRDQPILSMVQSLVTYCRKGLEPPIRGEARRD